MSESKSYIDSFGAETAFMSDDGSYSFSESLREIFSVLPDEKALEAQQKALQNFPVKEPAEPYKIHWADFDEAGHFIGCLLYTSPSPRDQRGSRMPSSA